MVKYKAALVITGEIKETSHDRLYQELDLESLADRKRSHRFFSSTKLYRDYYHLTFKIAIILLVKEPI